VSYPLERVVPVALPRELEREVVDEGFTISS